MIAAESIIKPLRPRDTHLWRKRYVNRAVVSLGYPAEKWFYQEVGIQVISAVEVAADKDGSSNGPEYHISISYLWDGQPVRVSSSTASWVLDQFGLDGAEEDNHVPHGVVRNFWRSVAEPLIGKECACKAVEPVIVENKGDFVWRP